jgi:importin subunit beta-1
MDGLVTVLQHAQSADSGLRTQAEAQLQQFAAQNYAGYLVALAGVLASAAQQPETRQLAGVVLKNSVQSTAEAKNVRAGPGPRILRRPR